MIRARVKRVGRMFQLGACSAARRFVCRHAGAGPLAQSWRPLILRWRRRVKTFANVTSVGPKRQPTVSYYHRVHKHFASQITNRNLLRVMPSVPAIRISGPLRVKTDHRWTRILLDRRLQTIGATPSYRATPASISSTSEIHQSAVPPPPARIRKLHPTRSIFARPAASRHGQFPVPSLEARAIGKQESSTPISTNRLPILRHDRQLFSRRMKQSGDGTVMNQARGVAGPLRSERKEKLVWRTLPTAPRSEENREPEMAGASSQSYARSEMQEDHVQGTSATAQSAAMQVTKLDPSILDGLAENVIARVEKRLRIERERRGL